MDNTRTHSDLKKMAFAALFAALTAVGAYMRIPVGPVPITLQVLFVFLAGAMLGSRWGTISMIVYVLLGIVGLPVFAGGASGIGVLFGPTGGYLIGFIIAAFIIGLLADRRGTSSIPLNAGSMIIGLIVIYALGVTQLKFVAELSFTEAITLGILPFLIGDFLKIAVASYIAAKYNI